MLAFEPVDLCTGLFGWEILPERAAETDVEELAAAADAEEGHPAADCLIGEREFPDVAAQVDLAEIHMVRFAVARRFEILATAEKEHVDAIKQGGD